VGDQIRIRYDQNKKRGGARGKNSIGSGNGRKVMRCLSMYLQSKLSVEGRTEVREIC